jgi:prolyl oligopeptidase PreP (S9A serine peptidase family)
MADDPYLYLEDSNSEKGMEFALLANRMCLRALGDPMKNSATYSRILKSLERDDRIPFVSKVGKDENGNDLLFNLWKDSKVS